MGLNRFCIGIALATSVVAADDWPRFRGPDGAGVSQSTGLPVEFGTGKNQIWRVPLPFSRSSPVVVGSRIFITAVEGDKLATIALDRATGQTVWRRDIVRTRVSPVGKDNDSASPSPVSDGTNVYAFFPDLGLVSYTAKGKERWRAPLGPFNTFYGLGGSPVLEGDTVLLVCDDRKTPFLIAVDARTGKTRWRAERKHIRFEGYTTPVIYKPGNGPAQVVVLGAHHIDAYQLSTGEKLWSLGGLAYFPVGSPVVHNGAVVASTWGFDSPTGPTWEEMRKTLDRNGDGRISREEAKGDPVYGEEFGAVDFNNDGYMDAEEFNLLRDGAVGKFGLVSAKIGSDVLAWRESKTYPSVTTPLVYQGVMYVLKTGGIVGSLNPKTGEVYKVGRSKDAVDEYFASPVAADGKVFLTSQNGKVSVLRAGPQWEVLAVNDLAEEAYATPAIAGGRLYVRTKSALYSFGQK